MQVAYDSTVHVTLETIPLDSVLASGEVGMHLDCITILLVGELRDLPSLIAGM